MPRLLILLVVIALAAVVAPPCAANTPIVHPPFTVHQVYPCSDCPLVLFSGFEGAAPAAPCAVPGYFEIAPGGPDWPNYVSADASAVDYVIKTISLTKTTPSVLQCASQFPAHTVPQAGTPNIRLRWPLMYEVPGTTWTLAITYGTPAAANLPGEPAGALSYVHQDVWTWTLEVTLQDIKDLLVLFRQLPFGKDEVPLISDEPLYLALQSKLDVAIAAYDAGDTLTLAAVLTDFELEVMDACIAVSPALPNPTGPGTGIANTEENPACCKLLMDAEVFFQPTMEPLTLSSITPSPKSLWPNDGRMVPVNFAYEVKGGKGATSAVITSVKANEAISAPDWRGAGGDYRIYGPNRVYLKASRNDPYRDRVYTITVTASDSSGAKVTKDVTVTVPRFFTGR